MLKVKTELKQSSIHGIGLFAAELIKKDTVIWDFDYDFDTLFNKDCIINDPQVKFFVERYSYRDGQVLVLCSDDARFMNHSLNSNTSNGKGDETIANRDINIGEEITCNYFEIDDNAHLKFN